MVNQAVDTTELRSAQAPAALFDDFARPHGFEAAARWRHEGRSSAMAAARSQRGGARS
jgi:hypothetical protein